MSFITGKQLPPADVPARHGSHGGAAVPRRDGPGGAVRTDRRGGRHRRDPPRLHRGGPRAARLQRVGRDPAPVRAGDGGARLRAPARQRPQVAGAVPGPPHHRQQHRRADGRGVQPAGDRRRPLPVLGGLPDPVPPQADPGLGPLRRHVPRSDLRAAVRPVDADAVDAVLHREPRSGRRMHVQLLVRLHRLHQLVVAERAAPDDQGPARRVRDAVRGRRHSRGAGRAPGDAAQHPRLDPERRGRGAQRARLGRPPPHGSLSRRRPRGRAPHPDGGGPQRRRRAAGTARRPARGCRTRSRSTCSFCSISRCWRWRRT